MQPIYVCFLLLHIWIISNVNVIAGKKTGKNFI